MANTLLLPIIFLIFGVMILWIIIGCKGWWSAKFWIINIACILFFVLWTTIVSYMGWGVPKPLPERFRFLGYFSDEPKSLYVMTELEQDKSFKIAEIFDYKSDDFIRLYKIPYSKNLHEQLEVAMERMQRGAIVFGSRTRILDAEEINGMNSNGSAGPTNGDHEHNFYIFPPARMFQKPQQ
jgi:hypothetical protein